MIPPHIHPEGLPDEDIFGNTKKLKFILDEVATYRRRVGREISVLDFGCGNASAVGRYLIGDGVQYFGVDFHKPSLDYARELHGGPRATFLPAVPGDVVFDVIVYADVLEHLHDPLSALSDHVRQLAPEGIVIGSVPNGYGACEVEKFIDRRLRLYKTLRFVKRSALSMAGRSPKPPESIPYNSESGHVVFFTLDSLRRMVAEAGLRFIEFGHGGFVGADLTANTIFRSRRFVSWNVKVADRLPSWAVSTWYFVLAKHPPPGSVDT
jgi:SAM-dependent methyltransferase